MIIWSIAKEGIWLGEMFQNQQESKNGRKKPRAKRAASQRRRKLHAECKVARAL